MLPPLASVTCDVPPATRLPPQIPLRFGTCLPPGPAMVGAAGVGVAVGAAGACCAAALPASNAADASTTAALPMRATTLIEYAPPTRTKVPPSVVTTRD